MYMRTVFWAITFAIGLSPSTAQEQKKLDQDWPCHENFSILRNDKNEPVKLNTDEAIKRALHCEAPIWPEIARRARIRGTVVIEIAVAPTGRVSCLHTVSGHPILNLSALEAAKRWVFRPMESRGQNVGFLALLVFYYSTDYTELSSKPDCTKARWK
jgi:TonB family protein